MSVLSDSSILVDSFEMMHGSELYVPRIPSMKITDLAQAVVPGADGFHYTSDTNEQWFTPEEITKILETDI